MKKYNDIIKVLVVVFTIAYAILIFVLIGFLATHRIDWTTAIIVFISCSIELVLLYALHNALTRISALEKKKDQNKEASDDLREVPDEVLQCWGLQNDDRDNDKE